MKAVATFSTLAGDEAAMHYRRLGSTDSSLKILCLHGLGSNSATFNPPQHLLNRAGFIIPDLLGHGDSSKPSLEGAYAMRAQAETVMQVLNKVCLLYLYSPSKA